MKLFDTSRPDAVALDDGTRIRSFGALEERLGRLGRLVREELGVAAGGRIAVLAPNRVEGVELILASLLHGVLVTPISHHLAPDEIAYVLEDSGAEVIFVDDSLAARVPDGAPRIVLLDSLDARLAPLSARPIDPEAVPGGTMIYTSGTSGRPKGVKRAAAASVRSAVDAWRSAGKAFGFDGTGPHLVTGPLYHAAPLLFAVYDVMNGAELIILPRWDERTFLETVESRRVSHTHLVPTTMVRLLRLPEDERPARALSSLTLVMHGAAPIRPDTKRAMIDWLGPIVTEYWGATEGGIYTLVDSNDWLSRPGTVGRATPTFRIDAVDDDGNVLPRLESGTLVCTHASLDEPFAYHRDADKTARAYLGPRRFTVGDLGWVDADGYVFLGERRSNLILSGGVNIYPAEIERVLASHPSIADVAVFGVRDEEWGERVVAAVELRPEVVRDETTSESILAFARERIAGFKVPRAIHFVDAMPRTEAGKLRVRDLRDAYAP